MAVSSYQSIVSSPMTSFSSGSRVVNQFSTPAVCMPSLRRNANLSVRSIAKEDQKEQPPQPSPTPSPKKKMSTKFTDLMAFDGPAPERINGRLAMIGFVSAIGVELANGQGVFEQLSNGGISWFLWTSVLFSVASLVPLLQGVSVESKSKRVFSSNAELLNGRLAMLGFIALAVTEYVKGSALV